MKQTEIIGSIETLKSVLGTMVIFPDIVSDPNNIGQKIHRGSIQQPILLGDNRKIAEDKLVELIGKL